MGNHHRKSMSFRFSVISMLIGIQIHHQIFGFKVQREEKNSYFKYMLMSGAYYKIPISKFMNPSDRCMLLFFFVVNIQAFQKYE